MESQKEAKVAHEEEFPWSRRRSEARPKAKHQRSGLCQLHSNTHTLNLPKVDTQCPCQKQELARLVKRGMLKGTRALFKKTPKRPNVGEARKKKKSVETADRSLPSLDIDPLEEKKDEWPFHQGYRLVRGAMEVCYALKRPPKRGAPIKIPEKGRSRGWVSL